MRSLIDLKLQTQALLQQMLAMSRQDIAAFQVALDTSDVEMTAATVSASSQLWSEMERLGWMTSRDLDTPPEAGGIPLRLYTITSNGSGPIADLMAAYAEERPKIDDRMLAIANGLCRVFTDQLVQRVRADGGSLRDVSALLALVVDGTIARSVKPGDR